MSRLICFLAMLGGLLLVTAAPTLAQGDSPMAPHSGELLPVALMVCFPLGLLLLFSSALPESKAPAAAIGLLLVWAAAALAYFAVGFAFQFGGIAQASPNPALAGLYWEWYPVDPAIELAEARLWGVLALQGWALTGPAITPAVLLLFLSHASLVGAAAIIPAGVLIERGRTGLALALAVVMGAIIYPVAGNWVWGGGWLSFLGLSLQLGHGFIDFGGGGAIFLLGATVALIGLWLFPAPLPPLNEDPYPADLSPNEAALSDSPAMPSAYLPILSMLGGGLLLLGWLGGLVGGGHTPLAIDFSPVYAAVAGVLAAFGGALAAAGYSWFTTRAANPLMTTRGLVAGLGVTLAGAPFLPLGGAIGAGLAMGVLLPGLIYWFDHKLPLRDSLGVAATFGVSGLIGLLLIPLLADGRAGQGWHQVEGAIGAGAPGQWQAQLAGIGVIILWGAITGGAALSLLKVINR